MSKKFAKTLEEKYGLPGKKGREGETFFKEFYEAKGYKVTDNYDNILLQAAGVDFAIEIGRDLFTVDVKNNLTSDMQVVVEVKDDGWLFNPRKKSVFISHVNVMLKTVVTYRRHAMQRYINDNYWDYRNKFIYLPVETLPFVKVDTGTKI